MSKKQINVERALDAVAEATPMREVASAEGVSLRTLYRRLDDHEVAFAAARAASVEVWLERAEKELWAAKAEETSAAAAARRERAKHARWMAEKLSRKVYGETSPVQVNIGASIGALHIEALQEAGNMDHQRLAREQQERLAAPVQEAEVVSVEYDEAEDGEDGDSMFSFA